jgi:hypothetical protein
MPKLWVTVTATRWLGHKVEDGTTKQINLPALFISDRTFRPVSDRGVPYEGAGTPLYHARARKPFIVFLEPYEAVFSRAQATMRRYIDAHPTRLSEALNFTTAQRPSDNDGRAVHRSPPAQAPHPR